MIRAGNLYNRISTYENLCLSFWKAARGKQLRSDVITFRKNFDANIKKLQNDLLRHMPDVGHYRFFKVFDPKPRSICAASFAERVLHHAIMNICEPFLEAYAIHDSYACRKGKGNRKALKRAQDFSRSFLIRRKSCPRLYPGQKLKHPAGAGSLSGCLAKVLAGF
jgi:RNA-directed DNA polymerase